MKSIGPYIVVREVSPAPGAAARSAVAAHSARTYWATERLTGIPALLHEVPSPMPAPDLPPHPALLPFSDLVVEGARAYLVTELPLNATPALDPMLTARSTLSALDALHRHGFAHGGIDAGQVWSADGRTMLAGAGLHQLGETYTVARDLHDLAQTLESLGGVPPILALLRDAPDTLTARDALDLLGYDSPASGSAAASARTPGPAGFTGLGAPSLPSLHPMSLLDSSAPLPQSGSYLWQASWTDPRQTQFGELQPAPAATVSSTQGEGQHAGESFQLDISQWDFPDFLEHPAAEHGPKAAPPTPVVITTAPAVLQWATPNRPVTAPDREATAQAAEDAGRPVQVAAAPQPSALAAMPAAPSPSPAAVSSPTTGPRRKAKAAALRAVERLRADANRQQSLAEARRDHVPAQWPAVAQGAEQEQGAASAPRETPQERRRREQAALQEQAEFDARAAAERKARAASEQVTQASLSSASLGLASSNLSPEDDLPTVSRRQLKPIRATWTADGRWQVLHDDAAAPSRPLWLWPAVAVGAALLLLLLVLGLGRRAAPAVATACCDVQFAVQGTGQSASLSVDEAPAASGLTLGESLGTVPGRVHFPAQGRYVVRVSAEGFTPARLALDVPPKEQPVNINLGQ